MIVVRILDGSLAGKSFKLTRSLTVGRSGRPDILIKDSKISRNHALIFLKREQVFIRDLDSKNGIFLDGERITEGEVPFGSTLTIGDTNLVLEDAIDESELIGHRLGAYQVIELVGKGGMGVVFRANQLSLDRIVALKMLNRSLVSRKGFVDRFVKEARAAGNLNHPNLIQVHDFGQEGEDYWFSMEFITGATVSQILRRSGTMPERLALHVAKEVAKALAYAHSRNLVHRDIKPSNIMIDTEGNVKVADLGIAETLHNIQAEGKKARVIGTPEYMSPEQAKGKPIDPRSDLYSLGATLFHMLAGRAPFKGKRTRDTVDMVANDDPPALRDLLPNAGQQIQRLLNHMMAKDPDQRIATATDLIAAIDNKWPSTPEQDNHRQKSLVNFMHGVEKPKRSTPSRYVGFRPRQVLLIGAAAAGLTLIIVGILYLTDQGKPPAAPPPPSPPRSVNPVVEDTAPATKTPVPEPGPAVPTPKKLDRFLAQAKKAYEAAEAYEENHGDDIKGRRQHWHDYLSTYDKTPDADKVRQRLAKLNEETRIRSANSFKVATTNAAMQAEAGSYFTAMTTIQAHTRGSHAAPIKKEAEALLQTYHQHYQAAFDKAQATANSAFLAHRYADVLQTYQDFIDTAGGGPLEKEAAALLEIAQKKMISEYKAVVASIDTYVTQFDYAGAEEVLQNLSGEFKKTPAMPTINTVIENVRKLKQLHALVIQEIRTSPSPKPIPFKRNNIRGDASRGKVITASEDQLSIDIGGPQQDLRWTTFTKKQVFQIYQMYLDEQTEKHRSLLESFAQQFKIKSQYYQP